VTHGINIFLKKFKNKNKKILKKNFKKLKKFKKNSKKLKNSKKREADTWHLLNGVSSLLTERT